MSTTVKRSVQQDKVVECTTRVRLSFDKGSKEFSQTFDDYREVIDRYASVDDMLCQVANYILKFGHDRLIEGIGYLAVDGKPMGEPFSGIYLENGDIQYDMTVGDDYPINYRNK